MARHGLIFNHNEATGSRKVFKCLPGFRDTIKKSKMTAKVQKSKNLKMKKIRKLRIFRLLDFEAIFEYYMVSRRSRRYLETFLEPVASL